MSMPHEPARRWPLQTAICLCLVLSASALRAEPPAVDAASASVLAPLPVTPLPAGADSGVSASTDPRADQASPAARSPGAAPPPASADATTPAAPTDDPVVEAVVPPPPDPAETLAAAAAPAMGETSLFSGRLLAEFYAELDARNIWDTSRANAMLRLAQASPADGFKPDDFHATAIRELLARGDLAADESTRTAADILLSDALLRYLHHFQYGKYDPQRVHRGAAFTEPADAEVLKREMNRVLAAADLEAEVERLLPQPPFYQNLKHAYQRQLAATGVTGPTVPGGTNLVAGIRDPRVAVLRERLATGEGQTIPPVTDPAVYDPGLVAAVKAFQAQSGLGADGVVGPATLRALNHPPEGRLNTLRANLERMRWLYHDLPADYVFVDLAAFRLQVMRNDAPIWETRTVIGAAATPTPMFREDMEYVIFNPDWTMPPSIQRKMRGAGSKYKVVDRRTGRRVSGGDVSNVSRYRIVQPPGPGNALGKVKFIFPNGHAIYLHDTPSKGLFANPTRAYSHGCVRVQNPLTLAEQILSVQNWDTAQVNRAVGTGRTRHVRLEKHLPVLLYYLTALADDQGRVALRTDLYGRDRALLAVLDKPADSPRLRFKEPEPPPEVVPAAAPATTGDRTDGVVPPSPAADGLPTPPATPAASTLPTPEPAGAAPPPARTTPTPGIREADASASAGPTLAHAAPVVLPQALPGGGITTSSPAATGGVNSTPEAAVTADDRQ